MSEHTPGPWEYQPYAYDGHGKALSDVVVASAGSAESSPFAWQVCRVNTPLAEPFGNRKANAHLIAAAPELLEALKSLLTDCETTARERSYRPETFDNIWQARAAIAKAKGG